MKAASSQASGVAFLVVGLVIGAGLVFVTTYFNGGYHAQVSTTTSTEISTLTTSDVSTYTLATTTTTTVLSVSTTLGTALVQASVVSCNYNTMVTGAEACEVVLTNSGNANTATTGSCSLSYGGKTHSGVVSGGGTVAASSYLTVTCAYTVGVGAGTGTQITGSIALVDGANALFSSAASS